MKKSCFSAIFVLSVAFLPFLVASPVAALSFDGLLNSCGLGGAVVEPYIKVGYQRMGVNLNFPIPQAPTTAFLMDTMDVKVNRADFLIGSIGVNTQVRPRVGVFGEVTVSVERSGAITTGFSGVASGVVFGGASGWSWPTERVRWCEVNLGGKFDIYDSFGILAGFKFDRLSERLTRPSEPQYQAFFPPVFREDYFGDLEVRTWSPYFGLRFEETYWRFDLIWSPWLTSYDVKMPLRVALSDSLNVFSLANADSRYGLTGGGGNLLELYGEGKFNIFEHLGAALWLKASWLQCRGNGTEDFEDTFFGTPGALFYAATSGSADATSTFTRSLWALGITGKLVF